MDKYVIYVEETAIYEIYADSKEEAEEEFKNGGGEFLGYKESEPYEKLVVEKDEES